MIYQIESIKTKTEALPTINKGLLHVRHIQARLNGRAELNSVASPSFWSPTTTGPFTVHVTRWIE